MYRFRRPRVAAIAVLTALTGGLGAAITLSAPAPASADAHCPIDDPNPPPVCSGEPRTTTTKKSTTPAPAPVALEPVVFIEVGGACAFGSVGTEAAATVSGILGSSAHSSCVGPDLRLGVWPSYQNPGRDAAVRRLQLMTARQAGETYAVRIAERYLQDAFKTEMEKNRGRIEQGGRHLASYTTGLVAPDLVKSRITVKKTVLGFEGRASADITDRIFVQNGRLACSTGTSIDTNAAADIGQAIGGFLHFTFNDDPVDIRGSFRSELERSGTPGCQMAALVPEYVLLRPLPVVGALRVNFTPTRAGVRDGNLEIGGTWAQTARDPRLGLGVNDAAARWVSGGVSIPLAVRPLDLSGTTHVKVKVGGVVRAEVDLPGTRGQEAPGQTVDVVVPMGFSEGAKATLTVTATDADGVAAREAQVQWHYEERAEPPRGCIGAKPGSTPKSALPVDGNCQTPGINPHQPPVASLNPQPEPPGVR